MTIVLKQNAYSLKRKSINTKERVMGVKLFDYQMDALNNMKNGCILCGGVGSGKSITSLAYYHKQCGGELDIFKPMICPLNLFIITTARKRDTKEWEKDMAVFLLSPNDNFYKTTVTVDSWNNIKKYTDVKGAFFIFDEQRLVGSGAWVKAFYKIAKSNKWILLSATPGDEWKDYIPVFVANGFYRNKTDFCEQHVMWDRFTRYPSIKGYFNTKKLEYYRNDILVDMDFKRQTVSHHETYYCNYDRFKYKDIMKYRIDPETTEPIENASQLCYLLRKVSNTADDRILKLLEICEIHPKAIIFYNFDYELEILKSLHYMNIFGEAKQAEWNGHRHEPIPDGKTWVYFVQYTAGAEGWNCIETDTMIFFSQNYSYRVMMQASGRIDRLNTPYHDLYYYHLSSKSPIDISIARAVEQKKNFNESRFVNKIFKD